MGEPLLNALGERGTGRTTRQMLDAPKGSVFVWCTDIIQYPKHMAHQLGRNDLVIVGRNNLRKEYFRGKRIPGIVLDHAIRLSPYENEVYMFAKTCCYK